MVMKMVSVRDTALLIIDDRNLVKNYDHEFDGWRLGDYFCPLPVVMVHANRWVKQGPPKGPTHYHYDNKVDS